MFCYANRNAQGLWGLTWDEFIRLPSRLSAEPLVQAERERLLARLRAQRKIPSALPILPLRIWQPPWVNQDLRPEVLKDGAPCRSCDPACP